MPGLGASLPSLNCCRTLVSKGMGPHLASFRVSPLYPPRIPAHPPLPPPCPQRISRPTYPLFQPTKDFFWQPQGPIYHESASSEHFCHRLSTGMPPPKQGARHGRQVQAGSGGEGCPELPWCAQSTQNLARCLQGAAERSRAIPRAACLAALPPPRPCCTCCCSLGW